MQINPFCTSCRSLSARVRALEDVALGQNTSAIPMDPNSRNLAKATESFEKAFIQNVLTENNGVRMTTAAQLGISRKNLWEKCRKHGIETGQEK